jgi:hypothetical protein
MPYETKWVPAEVFVTVETPLGTYTVYHTYWHDRMDTVSDDWYSTDPNNMQGDGTRFDVRLLDYPGMTAMSPPNHSDRKKQAMSRMIGAIKAGVIDFGEQGT